MTHIDLWEKLDTLLVDRPPGSVEFIKVKAHVNSSIALPPFLDRCRHYNKFADSAGKAAVKNADVFSLNKIRALCAMQDELQHVVGQLHGFIARYAEHELTKRANVAG